MFPKRNSELSPYFIVKGQSSDALKVLQFVSGKTTLTNAQKAAADVTKNGLVQASHSRYFNILLVK